MQQEATPHRLKQPTIFSTHKQAETPDDCQDACAFNPINYRYAIADGATQSLFGAVWSRLLVDSFCRQPVNNSLLEQSEYNVWLQPLQEEWLSVIQPLIQEAKPAVQLGLRKQLADKRAAAATFIGIQVQPARDHFTWQALVLGDSCLFHIHGNDVTVEPLTSADQFDNYPEAFFSIGPAYTKQPQVLNGTVHQDDVLILATDALAEWILKWFELNPKQGIQRLLKLQQLPNQHAFEAFVDWARDHPEIPMKNDDVTYMVLALTPAPVAAEKSPVSQPQSIAPVAPSIRQPPPFPTPFPRRPSQSPIMSPPSFHKPQAIRTQRQRIKLFLQRWQLFIAGSGVLMLLIIGLFLLLRPKTITIEKDTRFYINIAQSNNYFTVQKDIRLLPTEIVTNTIMFKLDVTIPKNSLIFPIPFIDIIVLTDGALVHGTDTTVLRYQGKPVILKYTIINKNTYNIKLFIKRSE